MQEHRKVESNRSLWSRYAIRLAVALLVSACAAACNASKGPDDGSETHWLNSCHGPSDCGGTPCTCGVCTTPCSNNDECTKYGPDAVCAAAGTSAYAALCSAEAPSGGICTRRGDAGTNEPSTGGTVGAGGTAGAGGVANTGGVAGAGGAAGGADASTDAADAGARDASTRGNDAEAGAVARPPLDGATEANTNLGPDAGARLDAAVPGNDGGIPMSPIDASEGGVAAMACTGSFEWPAVSLGPPGLPIFAVIGDINGDGSPDVVAIAAPSASPTGVVEVALGRGDGTFHDAIAFDAGAGPPSSVAIADIDGDGREDLVVTNAGDGTISVLSNTTAAAFTVPSFASKVDFGAGDGAASVVAADINGDGRPDLAVANAVAGTVSVLLNTTTGASASPSFASKVDLVGGTKPSSIAAADVNADGAPDLVVADPASNAVSVWLDQTPLGGTTAVFGAKTDFQAGATPVFVAAGDLDGDGKADLVVADPGFTSAIVFPNTTPTGGATPSMGTKKVVNPGVPIASVAISDLNGDAKLDLVLGVKGDTDPDLALLNTTATVGTGPTFAVFDIPARGHFVALGDVDRDGKPDVATVGNRSGVGLVRNTTLDHGTVAHFGSHWSFPAGDNDIGLATADLNGDGKPDIVMTGFPPESVLINTTPAGAVGPTFQASSLSLSSVLHAGVVAGDLNGDGKPDLVVTGGASQPGVSVVFNTTQAGSLSPSWGTTVEFPAGSSLSGVVLADLNTDGAPDIVLASPDLKGGSVSVLLNATAPNALAPSFGAPVDVAANVATCSGLAPYHAAAGDLNADGKPDIVMLSDCGPIVYLNTTPTGAATPSFAVGVNIVGGAFDAAIGDLTNDGKPDIVTSNGALYVNETPDQASVPVFGFPQMIFSSAGPYGVTIADLNADGKLDVAWADSGGAGGIVFNQTTDPANPSFTSLSANVFDVGREPYAVVASDFNDDGLVDLAFDARADSSVTVVVNACQR